MEMVNGSERGTKRKSKRLRPRTSTSKADNDNNDTKVTIRKSSRLISSLEVKKCTSLATTPEVNIMENGKNLRPSRQQYLLLPTELRCADISHKTSIRLGVQSCFCCNNFRLDKVFLANDATQDNVSVKKYGCRHKERIKVSVKYSHRHSHTSHPQIIQENEIVPVSVVPQKPSSTVKSKLAQCVVLISKKDQRCRRQRSGTKESNGSRKGDCFKETEDGSRKKGEGAHLGP